MMRLVPTDRKPDFTGVTPAFVAGGTLFVVVVLVTFGVNRHFETEFTPCLFKMLTGQPCFLCGGTRASISFATGRPIAAFTFNPLVTIVLVYLSVLLVLKYVFARKPEWSGPFSNRHLLWTMAILAVLMNWIYVARTL